MANRKRNKSITLRLTEQERSALTSQASKAHMTQSDFVLALLEKKPIVVVEDLQTTLAELKRQGNNLNQMTRMLHAGSVNEKVLHTVLKNNNIIYKALVDTIKQLREL